jgi:hypothetical protein
MAQTPLGSRVEDGCQGSGKRDHLVDVLADVKGWRNSAMRGRGGIAPGVAGETVIRAAIAETGEGCRRRPESA